MKKALVVPYTDEFIKVSLMKTDANFSQAYDKNRKDNLGIGKYLLVLDVTAGKEALYIPISIASGRKSTGFIYYIEGTAGADASASISNMGKESTVVTSGSISYAKIPAGKTTTFKILTVVTASLGKEYKFVITRINYKLNPNDTRYKRFITEIGTKTLKFKK